MNRRLLFVVNDSAFFVSHRLPLAIAAIQAGYDVTVATGAGQRQDEIVDAGLKYIQLPLARGGTNPFAELRLLYAIARLYRLVRPDLVHLVTIKPVLYGGILARLLRISGVVAAISGMGYLFTAERHSLISRLAMWLYRFALGHRNARVIVQNSTDRAALQKFGALQSGRDVLIPGSGVDLDMFQPKPMPAGVPLVVLPARMLWDKGVGEFVEAACLLHERGIPTRFILVGPYDLHNPAAISLEQLQQWSDEGIVEWWGPQDDMSLIFAGANLVVLPSYREGMPKALLEAAAAGRAVVTTDAPGCRDAIEPGKTGLLVPVRDSVALADAIEQLIKDKDLRQKMGKAGRKLAEREFAIEKVVAAHLEVYRTLSSADNDGRD